MNDLPKAPALIKDTPSTGRPTVYSKDMADKLLADIATTSDNMDTIVQRYGISKPTFYLWVMINEDFSNCFSRALENRALVYGDTMVSDINELEDYIHNESNDPRIMHARIQLHHRKAGTYQWLMSRYNRQVYGDKLDIDQHVTVEPAKQREEAWTQHTAEDATYTEEQS